MQYVIDPPVQPTVAVAGIDKRFPVRRIFCVGRNYAEHAREMGDNPDRQPPMRQIGTGTPAGVSALVPGDTVLVEIEGIAPLTLKIADSA